MLVSKITALPFFHSYLVSPTFIQHSPSGTSRATWQVIMKLFLSLCGLMPLFGPMSIIILHNDECHRRILDSVMWSRISRNRKRREDMLCMILPCLAKNTSHDGTSNFFNNLTVSGNSNTLSSSQTLLS